MKYYDEYDEFTGMGCCAFFVIALAGLFLWIGAILAVMVIAGWT